MFLAALTHKWIAYVFECEVESVAPGVKVSPKRPITYISSDLLFASCYERRELALPTTMWSISSTDTLLEESLIATLGPVVFKRTAGTGNGCNGKPRLAIKDKPAEPADPMSTSDSEESEEESYESYESDHEADAEVTGAAPATLAGDDAAATQEAAAPSVLGADQSLLDDDHHVFHGGADDDGPDLGDIAGTGVCEPVLLTKEEGELLSDAAFAKRVDEKLAAIHSGDGTDINESDDNVLEEVKNAIAAVLAEGDSHAGAVTSTEAKHISGETYDVAFEKWFSEFFRSVEAANAMQNRRGVVPPTTANASLVIRTVGCSMVTTWVHWPAKQRRNLAGREIKLDEKGCFIFSVAAAYPLIEFKTSTTSQTKHRPDGVPFSVLLDDVDAKMEQVKKGERPAVPRWALRTRDMADIAISKKATAGSDDTLAVAAVAPCFVCLRPIVVRCARRQPMSHAYPKWQTRAKTTGAATKAAALPII